MTSASCIYGKEKIIFFAADSQWYVIIAKALTWLNAILPFVAIRISLLYSVIDEDRYACNESGSLLTRLSAEGATSGTRVIEQQVVSAGCPVSLRLEVLFLLLK